MHELAQRCNLACELLSLDSRCLSRLPRNNQFFAQIAHLGLASNQLLSYKRLSLKSVGAEVNLSHFAAMLE
jgi:hypothetical protein